MAIRDRFRRAVRKSSSSTSTASTTTSASNSDSEASKPSSPASSTTSSSSSSKLAKTMSWRPKPEKKSPPARWIHPADRPLTETNLRHQEMLSGFTMTFGRSRSICSDDFGGISPCGSRRNSVDEEAFALARRM